MNDTCRSYNTDPGKSQTINGKLIAPKLVLVPLTLEITELGGPFNEIVYNLQNSSYPMLHI